MPTATFGANAGGWIEAAGGGVSQAWEHGAYYLGGAKQFLRRPLVGFDLYAAPMDGRALTPADVILDAELLLYIGTIPGASGYPCTLARQTHPDWDYLTHSWTEYKTATAWTNAGGDTATPTLAYDAPTVAPGEFAIPGCAPFVTDAIASRGGKVLLHSMNTDESPATTRFWTAVAALNDDRRPRLRVTYQSATPRPMEHPHGQALGATRPAPVARPARPALPNAMPILTKIIPTGAHQPWQPT